jgi:SPP1 gp7 family putative phage head morphogenesis protein
MLNGYSQMYSEAAAENLDFYEGGRQQFLKSAFNAPEVRSKLELLYTRTYEELKGVGGAMSQQLSRELTNGLTQGWNPAKIARKLNNRVDTLTRTRANVIARTEIINAHAEGQLDTYERAGMEKVKVQAEWSTAGDDRVCPVCASLDGVVMPVREARGLLPRHPNCRCSWLPAVPDRKEQGQMWSKKR